MKKLSICEQLKSACLKADEIVYQLKLFDTEYHPQEVRTLVNEFKWTTTRILSLCNEALSDHQHELKEHQLAEIKKIKTKYKNIKSRAKI